MGLSDGLTFLGMNSRYLLYRRIGGLRDVPEAMKR
jgi:hypothetical protein